jgi:hypothetical protein
VEIRNQWNFSVHILVTDVHDYYLYRVASEYC